MISRIAFVLLSAAPALAVASSPFMLKDAYTNRHYLSLDLSQPQPASVLKELAATKVEGAEEAAVVKGLVALQQNQFNQAIRFFQGVSNSSLLKDAALFFEARAHRKLGERSIQKGKPAGAESPCRNARSRLRDLYDFPPGPFFAAIEEERTIATFCYTQALLSLKRFSRAEPLIISLLESPWLKEADDRALLVEALLSHLEKSGRREEARPLAKEARREFPSHEKIRALAKRLGKTDRKEPDPALPPPIPSSYKRELGWLTPHEPRENEDDQIYRKAKMKERRGETRAAVKLYVKLLTRYPGSQHAGKVQAHLRALAGRLEKQKKLPGYFIREVKDLPPRFLYSLARSIWEQGLDAETYELFEAVLHKNSAFPKADAIHYFLGRIKENQHAWESAREHFREVVEGFSGSSFFDRAFFKVGLLSFLAKDYGEARKWFGYNVARKGKGEVSVTADLYWLSRALTEEKKKEKAEKARALIPLMGPLSYYTFLTGQFPSLDSTPRLPYMKSQIGYWNRYHLSRTEAFLAVGLPKAARETLRYVSVKRNAPLTERVAYLHHVAQNHHQAFILAYRLEKQKTGEGVPQKLIELIFPDPLGELLQPVAETYRIDPLILLSLIKQESAFSVEAESPAGAVGLMQLMPATARQVARKMGVGVPKKETLLVSEGNIRLGTRYLADLLKQFEGNLVLALIAYNAGPRRAREWQARWKNLPPEVFIELIPFDETRNYVKTIARNYFFYTHLKKNRSVGLKEITEISRE